MATYKVPQDVEADDKLLGPFSFRQFVYLIIVAASIGIAWILAQIFIGLIIIPMPFIIFFGALALPLKKDQPMETYLAAIFSFYFIKPRKRIWVPDGIESLVEITAPRQVEPERVKDINQHEAAARLSYLTDIIDSRGWSVRGAGVPNQGIDFNQNPGGTPDMFDDSQTESQRFGKLLEQSNTQKIQAINQQIQQQYNAPVSQQFNNTQSPINTILQQEANYQPLQNIQQPNPAIQPLNIPLPPVPPSPMNQLSTPGSFNQQPVNQQSASNIPPSPAIIELANNSEGLTVADVAQQAARIHDINRGLPEDEVNISLH